MLRKSHTEARGHREFNSNHCSVLEHVSVPLCLCVNLIVKMLLTRGCSEFVALYSAARFLPTNK